MHEYDNLDLQQEIQLDVQLVCQILTLKAGLWLYSDTKSNTQQLMPKEVDL